MCWQAAQRDTARVARRLYHNEGSDGVFRRDEGALLADFCQCLRALGGAVGAEPVGWQRWRRQRLEPTRDQIIVCAQRWYGIVYLAEVALLVGVKRQDVPPGMGTPRSADPVRAHS